MCLIQFLSNLTKRFSIQVMRDTTEWAVVWQTLPDPFTRRVSLFAKGCVQSNKRKNGRESVEAKAAETTEITKVFERIMKQSPFKIRRGVDYSWTQSFKRCYTRTYPGHGPKLWH